MKPAARIILDGIDITANLIPSPFGIPLEAGGRVIAGGGLNGPLLSITVTDNEGKKSDSVELEIDNREHYPAPKKGAKMQVWLGYVETGIAYMGSYIVDETTKSGRPLKMTVSAKAAALTTEIKSPRSRSYHEKTVGQIVNEVAGRHGRSAIIHGELSAIKIGHIDQSAESDVNFLTRLARRVGANFKLADDKIIFNKAGGGLLPSGSEAPTFVLREIGVTDWSWTGAERGDYKSVTAAWQNTKTGEREWVTEGEGKPRYRDRKLYKTDEEARRATKAQKSSLQRGRETFKSSFPGDIRFFSGAKVTAMEFDPDVDGTYAIKTVTHTLDNGGLKTSIDCENSAQSADSESDDD